MSKSARYCVECGRLLDGERYDAHHGRTSPVCSAHIDSGLLLGRRVSSTMRLLATKHGPVQVVEVAPFAEREH